MNEWWGYEHIDGSLKVRRGFHDTQGDMAEARQSPFVRKVYGPWKVKNREEAMRELKQRIREKSG